VPQEFPAIPTFWGVRKSEGALWSPSYLVGSVSDAPIEILRRTKGALNPGVNAGARRAIRSHDHAPRGARQPHRPGGAPIGAVVRVAASNWVIENRSARILDGRTTAAAD
jgi:hypothetical protein